ncbi:MAG TPA: hypothetical protein VLJ79_22495 [Candidatus Binatia bacterium]|nr:hypothetical protein [Candidatus Binatia bacterium]
MKTSIVQQDIVTLDPKARVGMWVIMVKSGGLSFSRWPAFDVTCSLPVGG